jgi:protein-S-isoprenylcysteine O-methyltransferase Ste14
MINPTRTQEQLINVLLFIFFGWGTCLGLRDRLGGGLSLVDISFLAQNAVFCLVILLRSPDREMSRSWAGQLLALAAFFSGMAFLNYPLDEPGITAGVGQAVVISANILAVTSLVTLGKSFGILIARRKIKTRGLYGIVRHPMYFSDILLRLGFFLVHPSLYVTLLVIVSIFLYLGRALWEEKFLSQNADYQQYCLKVRWRFMPGLF